MAIPRMREIISQNLAELGKNRRETKAMIDTLSQLLLQYDEQEAILQNHVKKLDEEEASEEAAKTPR